jgi:Ca2+:H+ antiporter
LAERRLGLAPDHRGLIATGSFGTICAVTRGLNRFETISVALAVIIAAAAGALALASVANTAVFIVSAAALVALAWIVGVSTEQLGASAGPKVGGVLNATFGNAAELIITIFAIRAGQLEVATASITGSILGNTLLVLGASFLIGGLKNGLQTFNQRVAGMNASMLALAVIGLGIPTLFGHVGHHPDVQAVSDVTAGILLALYVLMLVFYFRTPEVAHVSGDEPAGPHWPGRLALLLLLLSTAAVAVISDVFVGTLDAVISDLGISAVFLGLIIVPLVGNIAENIVGIKIAYQNDMDFSMLVSLGSSLQIALGVAPALVFISLLTPHHFDLLFPVIQVVSLAAAVFITALIAIDGESNWLEGAQLMAVYGIIATAVWYL